MLPFNADVSDVNDLARSLESTWGTQRKVDDAMLDLYRQRHVVPVTDPDQARTSLQGDINQDISPIGMGKGPQIVDQWAALMGGRLRPHVAPLGNSPEAQKHSTKLEEFSEGAFLRMEQRVGGSQFKGIRKDIALVGRGVGVVLPAPQLWSPRANPEFRQRKEESKIEWLARVNELKKGAFPITFTKLDARSTYFRFGEFSYDTVRIRQLKAGEIIKRFPKATVLKERVERHDIDYNSNVDVIDYFNDEWFGMFVGNETLKRQRHFMGMNPVVLFEGNPMPDNDEMRWYGILYHARHLIPAYDELISNILTNVRRDTRAHWGIDDTRLT